jgi:ParB family chromosome partitioning protein
VNVNDVSIGQLVPAPWNSNSMDSAMLARLRRSIETFGFLEPLVVRQTPGNSFEVIGGSHRLKVLTETGAERVPCVVVEADDAQARLLSQALNHIEGEEDPVRRAASLERILADFAMDDVLSLLPETAESLAALASLGSLSPGEYMRSWNLRKAARLNHLTFQLTDEQLETVNEAVALAMPGTSGNPNLRSNALVHICQQFIEHEKPL